MCILIMNQNTCFCIVFESCPPPRDGQIPPGGGDSPQVPVLECTRVFIGVGVGGACGGVRAVGKL